MGERVRDLAYRVRAGASVGTVATLAVALVATVFGVGALGRTAQVSDGNAWLWSGGSGQVSRVNAQTGRVDLRQPVIDARGHRVRVVQNDGHLILHDLDTGRVTSVDLRSLGFSGRLDVGARGDYRFVLGEHGALMVDRVSGEVRTVNPATLQPTGAVLRLPGPLVGGEFDGTGTLWVASPGQGTAIGVKVTGGNPVIAHTVPIAAPGRDLAVTVLDRGLLAVDRGGRDLVAVIDAKPRKLSAPIALGGAQVPERTSGGLAAVTVPSAQTVVTVADPGGNAEIKATKLGAAPEQAAVPFANRLYVPDTDGRRIRVYEPGGGQVRVVTVPDGRGRLELLVRENSLFINDPGGRNAAVVSPGGEVKVVDKHEGPSAIGGDGPHERPTGTPSRTSDPARPRAPEPSRDPAPGPSRSAEPKPSGSPQPSGAPTPTPLPTGSPVPLPSTSPGGDRPGAPAPVTALADEGQVRLSWTRAHSPDAPVDTYRVTWTGGSQDVPGTRLNTTVTGLTNGRAYQFRVTAVNRFGAGPHAQSEQVTPTAARPATPTGLRAQVRDGKVVLRWTRVADSRDYVVTTRIHEGDGPAVTRIVDNGNTVTEGGTVKIEAEISGLTPGSYSFTVVARGEGGGSSAASAPSNTVRVAAPPAPAPTPTPTPEDPAPTQPTPPENPAPTETPDPGPIDGGGGGIVPVDPGPDDGTPGEIPGHQPSPQ